MARVVYLDQDPVAEDVFLERDPVAEVIYFDPCQGLNLVIDGLVHHP